jgi:hypothetical protein
MGVIFNTAEVYKPLDRASPLIVCRYINMDRYSRDSAEFDLRQGKSYSTGTALTYSMFKPYGDTIVLRNSYSFTWDEFSGGIDSLKLRAPPCSGAIARR